MRILMLGNSFTFANNMPETLANLIDAEVVQHTRGGARLAEQLNPDTKMGGMTQAALENEKWDYVMLQAYSFQWSSTGSVCNLGLSEGRQAAGIFRYGL